MLGRFASSVQVYTRNNLRATEQIFGMANLKRKKNSVYRTVTVSLKSTNIFAQEQFGYGKGLSDVKILYDFIGAILSALTKKNTAVAYLLNLSDFFDYES